MVTGGSFTETSITATQDGTLFISALEAGQTIASFFTKAPGGDWLQQEESSGQASFFSPQDKDETSEAGQACVHSCSLNYTADNAQIVTDHTAYYCPGAGNGLRYRLYSVYGNDPPYLGTETVDPSSDWVGATIMAHYHEGQELVRIFATDTQGRVWKFSYQDVGSWDKAEISQSVQGGAFTDLAATPVGPTGANVYAYNTTDTSLYQCQVRDELATWDMINFEPGAAVGSGKGVSAAQAWIGTDYVALSNTTLPTANLAVINPDGSTNYYSAYTAQPATSTSVALSTWYVADVVTISGPDNPQIGYRWK